MPVASGVDKRQVGQEDCSVGHDHLADDVLFTSDGTGEGTSSGPGNAFQELGCDIFSIQPGFEMEMRAGGSSGRTRKCDGAVVVDALAGCRQVDSIVGVQGDHAVVMLNDNQVSVAVSTAAVRYDTRCDGLHGGTLRNCDIYAVVVPEQTVDGVDTKPDRG